MKDRTKLKNGISAVVTLWFILTWMNYFQLETPVNYYSINLSFQATMLDFNYNKGSPYQDGKPVPPAQLILYPVLL